MQVVADGWVTVVSSGARMFVQLCKKKTGELVAVDPQTNNEYEPKAFCSTWFCGLTGNHMGEGYEG